MSTRKLINILAICSLFILSLGCSSESKNEVLSDAGSEDGSSAGSGGGDASGGGGTAGGNTGTGEAGANGTSGIDGSVSGAGGAGGTEGPWDIPDADQIQVIEGGIPIPTGDGDTIMCYQMTCNSKLLECADCIDNDEDGLIDAFDPECLGPCDNTEGPVLAPGVGGETGNQCKRDCYFDFGNGPGNDDCHFAYTCDPLTPKEVCPYEESWLGTKDCPDNQSQTCLDMCLAITPNGCDCFGCCTFEELGKDEDGGDKYVFIGPTWEPGCTLDTVTDPDACPPCTPVEDCWNDCGRCEICIGKTEIPDDCFPPPPSDGGVPSDGGTAGTGGTGGAGGTGGTGGGGAGGSGGTDGGGGTGGTTDTRCPADRQPCGLPGDAPCEHRFYCVTGCCVYFPG